MKRLLFTIFLMIISAFSVYAEDIYLSLEGGSVNVGEEITVTAGMASETAALGSIIFTYDPDSIEYLSHSFSDGLKNANALINPGYKDNMIKISWISLTPGIDYTDFVSITFKAVGSGESTVEATECKVYTVEEEKLSVISEPATVTVKRKSSGGGSLRGSGSGTVKLPASDKAEETAPSAPSGDKITFRDLDGVQWAREAIELLAEKGIISGVNDTEFAPAAMIKRADFVCLTVRMLNKEYEETEGFADVGRDKYYYREVTAARAAGITSGVGDNMFLPEKSITRQEMFTLIYGVLKSSGAEYDAYKEDVLSGFEDFSSVAEYAKEPISVLVGNGIVSGSGMLLMPLDNATRAEAAMLIYKLYELINYNNE